MVYVFCRFNFGVVLSADCGLVLLDLATGWCYVMFVKPTEGGLNL